MICYPVLATVSLIYTNTVSSAGTSLTSLLRHFLGAPMTPSTIFSTVTRHASLVPLLMSGLLIVSLLTCPNGALLAKDSAYGLESSRYSSLCWRPCSIAVEKSRNCNKVEIIMLLVRLFLLKGSMLQGSKPFRPKSRVLAQRLCPYLYGEHKDCPRSIEHCPLCRRLVEGEPVFGPAKELKDVRKLRHWCCLGHTHLPDRRSGGL